MNDWVDAEHHVERAHELFDAGRWDEAESELRRALSLNPYQSEWHFNLGLTLEAAGRDADAADAFRDAFKLSDDPDSHAALLVGVNLTRAGRPGEALEWLERAEKMEPAGTEAQVHRIEALARTPEIDDLLLPVETGLDGLTELRATPEGAARLRNGNPGMVMAGNAEYGDTAWASLDGRPVAVGVYKAGELHPNRVFNLTD